jgi:serine/threonine-protein kinase HipA
MRADQKSPSVAGEKLGVWYADRLVGHLERKSASVLDIGFSYDAAWMAASDSFPVSIRMPLSVQHHEPAIVYPWLLNLLPEGRTLEMVGAILHVHEADVFAILQEMGGDVAGALEIRKLEDPASARKPRHRRLTEAELAEAIKRLPERPLLVGEDGIHMSVAGAQEKLPVVRYADGGIGLALDGAPSTHILKPRNSKFRAAVENEAFCLRLATAVKLPAAEASMHSAAGVDYLLVKRYDRIIENGTVRRLHQEDFCQATGFPPSLKYEWNAQIQRHGPGLKACLDALNLTSRAAANKIRFMDYMLFSVLCGNVDAHAKNYSLLIEGSADVTMAPLYDVMNGDIYENVTRNLAMRIAGKQRGGHIYARHWNQFAEDNGLSKTQVRRRVAELTAAVLKAVPGVVDELEKSNMPSPAYKEIAGYVTTYCRSMLSNLKNDPVEEDEADDKPDAPRAR